MQTPSITPPSPASQHTQTANYRDVFALVTSLAPWSPAGFAGVDIAASHGANLTACYMEPYLRSMHGSDNEPTVFALLLEKAAVDKNDANAFAAFAHARGIPHVTWATAKGPPAWALRRYGAWHDLIIVEQDLAEPNVLFDVLGEVLMSCRAPVLVLPQGWDTAVNFDHVVMAWNGSIEATRAIHAALPIAQKAQRVFLLRDDALDQRDDDVPEPAFEPEHFLRNHGIDVSVRRLHVSPHGAGARILEEARALKADCLVMGAYGHHRLRERILGGATMHVLKHSPIPVLMQH